MELLPNLQPTENAPSREDVNRWLQRPWIDHIPNWTVRMTHPIENMPDYGREIARAIGEASLLVMCKPQTGQPSNDELTMRIVQIGIDNYYTIINGGGWRANGGHASGRKWPIIFAGIMLDNKDMQNVQGDFGEDMQTYYGQGWTGATALWRIIRRTGFQPEHEHQTPDQWPKMQMEGYRRCCTAVAFVGQALAARLMNATDIWNHDAFFDYTDRWMTEDDAEPRKAINAVSRRPMKIESGTVWDEFTLAMWQKYRGPIIPLHSSQEIFELLEQGKPLPK